MGLQGTEEREARLLLLGQCSSWAGPEAHRHQDTVAALSNHWQGTLCPCSAFLFLNWIQFCSCLYSECCLCCWKEPIFQLEAHEEKSQIPLEAPEETKIFESRIQTPAGLSEGGMSGINIKGDNRGIRSPCDSSSRFLRVF